MEKELIDSYEYMVIDNMPTNFRSYNIDKIYIRGLYYPEALSLAKYIGQGKTDYNQLALIYKEAIKGISIYDLEISDFIVATIISSIYTQKDFGWVPNVKCIYNVDNPQINEYQDKIEELKNLEMRDDEQDEELKRLIFDLPNLEEIVPCDGVITEPIILDDLDFVEPDETPLPIKHIISGKEYVIAPLTLRDVILIEMNKEDEKYDEIMFSYSRLIKSELSDEAKYKVIATGRFGDIQELEEIDKKFSIEIKPVTKKCPKCGKNIRIQLGLMKIKAHP